jgi:biotin carboxylase
LNDKGLIPDDIFKKAANRTGEEGVAAAEKIGYEGGLMIKAREGGSGKGIRFVDNEKDLRQCFHSSSKRSRWVAHFRNAIVHERAAFGSAICLRRIRQCRRAQGSRLFHPTSLSNDF